MVERVNDSVNGNVTYNGIRESIKLFQDILFIKITIIIMQSRMTELSIGYLTHQFSHSRSYHIRYFFIPNNIIEYYIVCQAINWRLWK